MKLILLGHQNNFVGTLKIMSNAAKNFIIIYYNKIYYYIYYNIPAIGFERSK